MAEKLKITLVKSPIGAIPKQRATVEALGLRKLNKTVELLFYQSKVICYLMAYKWQTCTWSVKFPFACI